jgi:hypothetical protein
LMVSDTTSERSAELSILPTRAGSFLEKSSKSRMVWWIRLASP